MFIAGDNVVVCGIASEYCVLETLKEVVRLSKAIGFNVGGKIGVARCGEHLCVAIVMGVGVLNLNELCVGVGHRSVPANI